MTSTLEQKVDSGDIVSMKSLLAFDEDIVCRVCNSKFTLAEGNWEGVHPQYSAVKAIGLMCPNCKRVNVAYYKTATLDTLENRVVKKKGKAKEQALRKYINEFMRVQNQYAIV